LNNLGLSQKQVKALIQGYLDKNADLIIGIDDPELVQLIDVLCQGVAFAVEKNNQNIQEQLKRAEQNSGFSLFR
jgi:hypothetical protein